ncbi:hypothetical protein HNQ56_000868 [Anaerotaenia torta]|uniref:hypothetical protein n=1 Tax=Anaerotaenia torta TaxID=433293 RepID=UPI003D1A9B41
MKGLAQDSIELLKQCIIKHNDSFLWTLEQENESKITEEIYNDLREIVCDELMISGFDKDDNVNEYGVVLEKLIDDIGDIFMT